VTEDTHSVNVDIGELTEALTEVLPPFKKLNHEARARLLQTIATIFGFGSADILGKALVSSSQPSSSERTSTFSEDRALLPKDFMFQKQPKSDVERVACLAYYLTHYRDTPYFGTIDISKLNTEAAQHKFSNAAQAVDNATKYGYLVQATKGNKQISPVGERFVEALPNRDEAKAAMANARPKRRIRRQRTMKKAA
jgi:hypothetical protein